MAVEHNDGAELNRWVQHQDATAFKALVDRHAGMVYATCRRILGSPAEAEDVAQECFESLARYEGSPPAHLGPWLHRVATNLACKRVRSAVRRRHREEAYAAARPQHVEPRWDDVYRYVDEAIEGLPERLRDPLVAHFIAGQTHRAIAERLGLSRQTVTDRIAQGIKQVRKRLGQQDIRLSIPLLASFLGSELAGAAPPSLTATLGKLALSGVRRGLSASGAQAAPLAPLAGGAFVVKKFIAAVVVLAILLVAGFAGYSHWMRALYGPPEIPPVTLETGEYSPIETMPFAAAAEAEIPAPPTETEEAMVDPDAPYVSRNAFVSGRVVDESDAPVGGATVTLERGKVNYLIPGSLLADYTDSVQADEHGYFAFTAVPLQRGSAGGGAREYDFHLRAQKGSRAAYRFLDVSPMVPAPYVELTLIEGGVLAGMVHDDRGAPIANAEVAPTITGSRTSNYGQEADQARLDERPVLTDAAGRFRIPNVVGGFHRLEVRAPGFGRYLSDRYQAGSTNIDITIPRGQRISGVVISEKSGKPVPNQLLVLNPMFSSNPQRGLAPGQIGRSGDDGAFQFSGLVFGPYEVIAANENSPTMQRVDHERAAVVVPEGEDVTGLKVRLRDGAAVEGRLLEAETRRPLPHTLVWITSDPRVDYAVGRTVTDEAGRFQFTHLSEGDWLLQAMNDPQRYRISLRAGQVLRNSDILVPLLDAIHGRVVDEYGAPLEGAAVVATGSFDRNHMAMHFNVATAETDEGGYFSLSGLTEPDKVTVQAHHGGGVSRREGPFRWGPGGKKNVLLTVETPGHLSGAVVDHRGQPVEGAIVAALPHSNDALINKPGFGDVRLRNPRRDYQGEATAFSGPKGRFDLGWLLADNYTLEVRYRGDVSQHRVGLARGEQADDVRLVIDRGAMGAVEGVVTWGQPLPGIQVHTRDESVTTDENGRYRFNFVPEGECYVHLTHYRSENGRESEHDLSEKVMVSAGRASQLDFAFSTEGGAVEGIALLNGTPPGGATVEAGDISGSVGPDGHYRIEGLPDGVVTVALILSPFDQGAIPGTRVDVEIRRNTTTTADFDVYAAPIRGEVDGVAEDEQCRVAILPGDLDPYSLDPAELQALFEKADHVVKVLGTRFHAGNVPSGPCTVVAVAYPQDESKPDIGNARIATQSLDIQGDETVDVSISFR